MEMFKEMAVFVQVADKGNFAAAARELGLTTSSVSRHVSRLEAHLRGRLIHRTTRAMALTELGEQAYVACAAMLAAGREVYALAGNYSDRPSGILRVSAPIVLGASWLAPRLGAFLNSFPDVNVRMSLSDRKVDLLEDGFDLAIRIGDALPLGVAARQLATFRYVLVAAPGYLKSRGTPRKPSDLLSHECITLGYGDYASGWDLRCGDASTSVAIVTRASINTSAAIVAMAEAGAGIGLVPEFAARAGLLAGTLKRVLPRWEVTNAYGRSVHAIYPSGKFLSLKVRAFIDYLVDAVGASGQL